MALTNPAPQVWPVGALCRAIADALESRFNPITVQGEISGFSRAASGHCYLSLKDSQGQIRCAMFKRAASLLDFTPRDGEQVQVRGRLGVYEQRGDLQLVIESMSRVGQGALFEQFLRLKAKLEAEGLFDARHKRPWPVMPRTIGLVTSLGAAALHDVVTALQRRAPHVRVVLAPAAVQGAQAPSELVRALHHLYRFRQSSQSAQTSLLGHALDGILIVRGGGSLEDLWAFNDEALVRTVAESPVPVIAGIGHETDFSLVDFVADIRAPTPTAAAELVTQDREVWLSALDGLQAKLRTAALRPIDQQQQRLDSLTARLGRPSGLVARHQMQIQGLSQRMRHSALWNVKQKQTALVRQASDVDRLWRGSLAQSSQRLTQLGQRLDLLDPQRVLQRGYAWVAGAQGRPITQVAQARAGQALRVRLVDGALNVTVADPVG
jgi:exodeoxyribonuclease VII large subunit